jgi:hypothetical protein
MEKNVLKFAKSDGDKLAELEADIVKAEAFLVQAAAAHRAARIDLGIAVDELAEKESPANFQTHQAALAASRATSEAKADAAKALDTAQLALELAHTAPARVEVANVIRKGSDRVERAMAKLADPLTKLVVALDEVTFPEVFLDTHAPSMFHGAQFNALMALRGPDGQAFVAALRAFADQVVAGQRSHKLAPTVASEQIKVGLRKAA